jgi:hypothetical protein
VAREYRENAVSIGTMYKSAVEVKDAVKRWSTLTLQREFRVVKSSPHIYDVVLFEFMLRRASGKLLGDQICCGSHLCT